MRKKVMLYLMMLTTAAKFLSMAYLFSTEPGRLPLPVYVSTGVVLLFGIGLICKNIIGRVSQKPLTVYYIVYGVSVVLNLVFMKAFSRAELTLLDFLVIGTLLDVAICAVLVFLSVRESRYIRIHVNTDR